MIHEFSVPHSGCLIDDTLYSSLRPIDELILLTHGQFYHVLQPITYKNNHWLLPHPKGPLKVESIDTQGGQMRCGVWQKAIGVVTVAAIDTSVRPTSNDSLLMSHPQMRQMRPEFSSPNGNAAALVY